MTKKIIGSIGILVGLGLATFLVYTALFPEGDSKTSPSDPAVQSQAAVQPQSESPSEATTSQPESAASQDPATPPAASAPAASDPIALAAKGPAAGAPASKALASKASALGDPAAAPTSPAAKIEQELQTPLEPTKEYGLLAGRYRGYGSANKRMEKIKEQDLPAFVRPKGKYYEVWSGPFVTAEEAEQARKSLRGVKIYAKTRTLTIPVPK